MSDLLHVRRLTPRLALAVAFVAMLTAGNAAASSTTITVGGTSAPNWSYDQKANLVDMTIPNQPNGAEVTLEYPGP